MEEAWRGVVALGDRKQRPRFPLTSFPHIIYLPFTTLHSLIPLLVHLLSLSLSLSVSLRVVSIAEAVKKQKKKDMLLGKRSRPEIKRTTSMTGMTFDLSNEEAQEQSDLYQNPIINGGVVGPELTDHHHQNYNNMNFGTKTSYEEHQQHLLSTMLSPRNINHRRNSVDFVETAHFLRTCGLCKRHLASGRDIYMYRYVCLCVKLFLSLSELNDWNNNHAFFNFFEFWLNIVWFLFYQFY